MNTVEPPMLSSNNPNLQPSAPPNPNDVQSENSLPVAVAYTDDAQKIDAVNVSGVPDPKNKIPLEIEPEQLQNLSIIINQTIIVNIISYQNVLELLEKNISDDEDKKNKLSTIKEKLETHKKDFNEMLNDIQEAYGIPEDKRVKFDISRVDLKNNFLNNLLAGESIGYAATLLSILPLLGGKTE